jgi:hypothetical protein
MRRSPCWARACSRTSTSATTWPRTASCSSASHGCVRAGALTFVNPRAAAQAHKVLSDPDQRSRYDQSRLRDREELTNLIEKKRQVPVKYTAAEKAERKAAKKAEKKARKKAGKEQQPAEQQPQQPAQAAAAAQPQQQQQEPAVNDDLDATQYSFRIDDLE